MVKGLESFIEQFREFPNCYTVIGGAACDILMTEAGLDFRATKDIDMILVLEGDFPGFGHKFWEYIKKGGYRCGWKSSELVHFYRFTEPQRPDFPVQIELFSRNPGYQLEIPQGIIPIHIDDETSSLSAILLDDNYYGLMMQGRKPVEGVTVLGAEYLIPFKMYAWLDLRRRKEAGEQVDSRNLRKHKLDVFRLLQIVPQSVKIAVGNVIQEDIAEFLKRMEEENLNLGQIGIPMSKEEALEQLRRMYL